MLKTLKAAIQHLEVRDSAVDNRDCRIGRHCINEQFKGMCLTLEMICQGQKGLDKTATALFNEAKQLASPF